MKQSIIERAMLKKYCEKQKEERAARWIMPSAKDIKIKAGNDRISIMFRSGVPL